MWELDHEEDWVPKNWCFRIVVLEKTLESPLDSKEINKEISKSILKEINSEYSLEGLMLKLKHQYFGHLMWRADSLEKSLMLGKIEGKRRRGWQRIRWLDNITDSHELGWTPGHGGGQGNLVAAVHGVAKSQTWLSYRMTARITKYPTHSLWTLVSARTGYKTSHTCLALNIWNNGRCYC